MTISKKNRIIAALTDIRNNAYEQAAIAEIDTDVKKSDFSMRKPLALAKQLEPLT